MDLVDRLQRGLPPFALWLGMVITEASEDRVVAEMPAPDDFGNGSGVVHGGAIMAFADTMGALGSIVNLRPGQTTTTLESKTNFFAPAPLGSKIIAEATPLHRGRRTQVWETRLTNEAGRLLAKVTQTQIVL